MAQPQPNYLQQVNAALAQRRKARRGRIDSMIDPMEEAARMDRLQGTTVSADIGAGGDDPGYGGATLATVAGGGGGPIRMASMPSGRGPIRSAINSAIGGGGGECVGGQCGVPRSASTVAGVPGGMMFEEPAPPTPNIPARQDGESDSQYMNRVANAWAQYGIPLPHNFARSSVLSANEAQAARNQATELARLERQWLADAEQARLNTANIDLDKAESARNEQAVTAEVALVGAKTANERLRSPVSRAEDGKKLLDQAVNGSLAPDIAIDALADLEIASGMPVAQDGQGTPQPKDKVQIDADSKVRNEAVERARRMVLGRLAVKDYLDQSPYVRGLVKSGASAQGEFTAGNSSLALEKIASVYHKNKMFDGDWASIDTALSSDVTPVLMDHLPKMFAAEAERSLPPDMDAAQRATAVEAARESGKDQAIKFNEYVRNQMRVWQIEYKRKEWNPSQPFAEKPTAPASQPTKTKGRWEGWRGSEAIGPISPFEVRPEDTNDTMPEVPAQFRRAQIARSV